MRVSSLSPSLLRQPPVKSQPILNRAERGRASFQDTVSFAIGSTVAGKPTSVAPTPAGPEGTAAARGQTFVGAKISTPPSDTIVPSPETNEPSAMAKIFGWSPSTPKTPAPQQTQPAPVAEAGGEIPRTGDLGIDSMAALTASLKARGVNPDSLGLHYSEEEVFYPGGSYTNKLITGHINGDTENFGAALVLKNSAEFLAVEM